MKKLILIFFIIPNIMFASSMMMIGEKGADLVLGKPAPEPIIAADDSKL